MMKRVLTSLLFLTIGTAVLAQDTTIIQTLTFDSITTRRGWWQFPDETEEYRKVLMYYTLKCDAATTADQYACGEWDYLTYSFVYDHTGVMDSASLDHPQYLFGTQNTEELVYDDNPLFDLFHSYDYFPSYSNTPNEDTATVGVAATLDNSTFNAAAGVIRSQYLWRADELTAGGLYAGDINRMMLNVDIAGSTVSGLTIRMMNSSDTALYDFVDGAFTTVYHFDHDFPGTGWQTFDFINAFTWDGTSNVIIEYSYEGNAGGTDSWINADVTAYNSGVATSGNQGHLVLDNNNYIQVPVNGIDLGDEVTISFWSNGDPDIQPENSYMFEGVNTAGQRVLNAHLPWSNGRIYWDAGEGSGYDRIDKQATVAEYEGNWVHWAFTKNATDGTMKIYKNGALWHSGTGLNRIIGEVDRFYIGRSGGGNSFWHGKFDEFRIWDIELDEATIAAWMNQPVNATHPNYADLVVNYNFDDGYNVADQSPNGMDAYLFGAPEVVSYGSSEVFFNSGSGTVRPQTAFIQGDHVWTLDSVAVVDSVMLPPVTWTEFAVNGYSVYPQSSGMGWNGTGTEYAADGTVIGTTTAPSTNTILNDTLFYNGVPFEVIDRYEIGRYITPYGINLTLGPQGFTWVYDVTDYAHLLRDSVDLSAGNNQELIDLKFMFIEGEAPRPVKKLNRVWGQMASHSYANLDNDVVLQEQTIDLEPETEYYKVITRLTGHGHNSNSGNYPHCCEWKDNTHYLMVNGQQAFDWHIWQETECAFNPVFPQGGTWPGSREGWCPGDVVKNNEFEITDLVSGSTVSLDYDITDVPANNQGMGGGNYVIAMHLMQYGEAAHALDAELYDVLRPNDWEYYGRINPICTQPMVKIRNSGTTTLTSLKITYGVSGGTPLEYAWTGNLDFMEETIVELPIVEEHFWDGDAAHRFTATLSEPNGSTDEYADNDSYTTHFELPVTYEDNFIIRLLTNNRPEENEYTIKNMNGDVVFHKANLAANTTYWDTLDLPHGCYHFEITDTGLDGLDYWADPNQGSGLLRFKRNGGSYLETFEREFGNKIHFPFAIGWGILGAQEAGVLRAFDVYPNPNDGRFRIELSGFNGDQTIHIVNSVGQTVFMRNQAMTDYFVEDIDLNSFGAGLYYVRVTNGTDADVKTVVVK